MGLAQGRALREKIAAARGSLERLEAFRLEQPRLLPYWIFLRIAERKAGKALGRALARSDPRMLARLEGIAEGAGLRPESVHLMNVLEAFLSSLEGRTALPGPGACSIAAVRGRRSAAGEPVVAKNFDYLPLVQPFYTVRDSRPEGGMRSLDFTVAPLGGSIDGLNEKGLCIAFNYAFATDRPEPSPTISMAISDALASCDSVAAAAERISSRPRWGAGILLLADATGDMASLELSSTRAALRRPHDDEDVFSFTNIYACEALREAQVSREAIFSRRAPRGLQGQSVLEPHEVRARRIADLLAGRAQWSPEDLAALLADHGPSGVPGGSTPCVHTEYWSTTACLQYFPRSRRIRISRSSACSARFEEIGL